jgi:hypothetical protein
MLVGCILDREAMEMGYTAWAERAFDRHLTMRAACSQPLGQETLEKGHYHRFLVGTEHSLVTLRLALN